MASKSVVRRVTGDDVARDAGVSRALVSYVMNNAAGIQVRDSTRRRILEAASRLHYRPNHSARAVRLGRFNCLALLLGTKFYLPQPLLEGLFRAAGMQAQHLLLSGLPERELTDVQLAPLVLRELMVDGILLNCPEDVPGELFPTLERSGLPCISINLNRPADCVYPADREAAALATRHVLELGHRRVGYINLTGSGTHYSQAARAEGYAETLRQAGLEPRVLAPAAAPAAAGGMRLVLDWLLQPERPTAILAYSTPSATALMLAAAHLGLSVPQDLSVITIDMENSAPIGLCFGRCLTSFLMPWRAVAHEAVDMLLAKIAQPDVPLPSRAVPYPPLQAGESCSPPPRG